MLLSSCSSDCFMAGHKVITNRGIHNIEDIKVGDMVLSHDLTYNRVNNVIGHIYSGHIFVFTEYGIDALIFCTPEHKFFTFEAGWVEARNVTFDHHILLANRKEDDLSSYSNITSVSVSENVVEVMYNLCVEKTSTYTVNGVVVYAEETN